ncbi:unnamed protein product [Caenorhabditis angaria]|uniref:ubiquitinyl hydrolase 1 n=1 Tax=Caenorhabditis angaria TaxID=860376 RepID=A0A9P1N4F2_9PELO|nr:unnamed protein product [Caenorhabditis angaria]
MTILPSSSKKKCVLRKIRKSPRPEQSLKRSALSSPRIEPASKKSVAAGDSASTSGGGGVNSDDEYDDLEAASNDQIEKEFAERLAARGLIIKEMIGDGACMFRAIAEQVYGDQEMHSQIRHLCMNYMAKNRDYFQDFITEDFDSYIERKRDEAVHGNHLELQAISELFARPVEIYQYSDEPISTLLPRGLSPKPSPDQAGPSQSDVQNAPNAPIRLSYHGAVHYNAILDPNKATIGVGLGLPGLSPKAAEKALMSSAMASSEREHIEETMLKDKLDMTDWQRTQKDIEEQISRDSYLTYLREIEKTDEAPTTSATTSGNAQKSENQPGLYEELLAAQSLETDEWDEDMAIAQALLLSQQDYLSTQGPSTSSK